MALQRHAVCGLKAWENLQSVRVKASKRSSNVKSKELTPVVIDEDDSGEDDVEVDESDSSGESGSDSYSECESENDTEWEFNFIMYKIKA